VKIELLPGQQIFAYAGEQGQAARFKFVAEIALAMKSRRSIIMRLLLPFLRM
jgi:hypothetical protein